MPQDLSLWNAPALHALQTILGAAAPFRVELHGVEVDVTLQERIVGAWPEPPPLALKPSEHGAWPDTLVVRAEWAGGSTSFRVEVVCTGKHSSIRARRYDGLVALAVETRTGHRLIWVNVPAAIAKDERDEVELCVLTAIVKRQDNSEQTLALANLARSAGLAFGTRKKVSLGRVRVPSGELVAAPLSYWKNLITFCVLKLPFFSADRRDFDGTYFTTVREDADEDAPGTALETVTGTTHAGFMIPVLSALSVGPQDPASIERHVLAHVGTALTAGDRRRKKNGGTLWRYNVRWALSYLKQRGEAENLARSQWSITAAGKKRLEQELTTFDIRPFQTLQAKVLTDTSAEPDPPVPEPTKSIRPVDRAALWHERLAGVLDAGTLEQLFSRIRPDLGATPADAIARNLIFVGPPGTGKTWLAERVALALTGEQPSIDGAVRLVQFHPSYGYEDFVWSIRPVLSGENAGFREFPGPFLTVCKHAAEDPDELYVLIVDEINRGDPARIFGELLYALEYRGREVRLAGGDTLVVPTNLVVIGTMNSADRSVGMLDYALRRRFAFLRLDPTPSAISKKHGTKASFVAAQALTLLNRAIRELGDPELQLGHSYFLSPGRSLASEADLALVWELDLHPQLAELFYGRGAVLEQLTRVWADAIRDEAATAEPETEDDDEEDEDVEAEDVDTMGR